MNGQILAYDYARDNKDAPGSVSTGVTLIMRPNPGVHLSEHFSATFRYALWRARRRDSDPDKRQKFQFSVVTRAPAIWAQFTTDLLLLSLTDWERFLVFLVIIFSKRASRSCCQVARVMTRLSPEKEYGNICFTHNTFTIACPF